MPEETPSRSVPHTSIPASPRHEALRGTEAEVVSLLEEFENSVEALRKLCARKPGPASPSQESSALPQSAAQKRAKADQEQINELRSSLETLRNNLACRSADLDQRSSDNERVRRELAMEVDRQKAQAAQQSTQDAAHHDTLHRQEETLSAKLAALTHEAEVLQKEKTHFHQSSSSVDTQRAQLEALRAGVDAKLREVERREIAIEEKLNAGAIDAKVVELNARLADSHALAECKSGELAEFRLRQEAADAQVAELERQLHLLKSAAVQMPIIAMPDLENTRAREKIEELEKVPGQVEGKIDELMQAKKK